VITRFILINVKGRITIYAFLWRSCLRSPLMSFIAIAACFLAEWLVC